MLAFLQYLIAVVIVQAADLRPGLPARPDWAGIALTVTGFAIAARTLGLALARRTAGRRGGALPSFLFATNAGRGAAVAAFYAIALPLGGVRIPAALGVDAWVIVPRLVQLAPFLALTIALTWGLEPLARRFHAGPWTSARAVAAELRQAVLPLAPVLAIIVLEDLGGLAGPATPAGRALAILGVLPSMQAFTATAVVFGVLLVLPFVLKLVWRAKPLPAGTLRERLLAYSRRNGFRFREILVWPTGGGVLNAAVIGVLPRFRYVLVTDGLLATLAEDEVEAVFAHEAGHARRGHMLLFFGFTSVLALVGLVPGVADVLGVLLEPLDPLLRYLVVLLVWLGVVLGWISRRFEQEADVFGIDTLPLAAPGADPAQHPFARAMERIGAEVGAIREVTGWRHFSIADRVEFVRRYLGDEDVRRRYRRSILALRGTLLVVIGGFTLGAAVRVPGELRQARILWESTAAPETALLTALHFAVLEPAPADRAARFAEAASYAAAAGRGDDAARWLRESVALGQGDPVVLQSYATMIERTGRTLGARMVWDELSARADVDPGLREAARRRAAAPGSR